MADFVAVIRKAVDGLASNTPENRAKVYEKARGAVVRQLENMKPRPSEALLARQIAKLDAAVAEVENEYAAALPPLDEADAPVAGAAASWENAADDGAGYDGTVHPAGGPSAALADGQHEAGGYFSGHEAPQAAPEPAAEPLRAEQEWRGAARGPETGQGVGGQSSSPLPFGVGYGQEETYRPQTGFAAAPRREGEEPVTEGAVAGETPPRQPAVEDYSSYFQNAGPAAAPQKTPQPALPRAGAEAFSQAAADPAAGGQDKQQDKQRSAWDDLDDLIGYGEPNAGAAPSRAAEEPTPGVAVGGAANAYRVRKPRRNYAALILSLCGVVLLAGGAFAVWMNRDALNDMVGGLIQSAQTVSPSTQQAAAPAASQPSGAPKAGANGQPAATPGDDGSVRGTKFTQRLLANGTERDEGPGPNGQPATAEGQSVYQQNEAPAATAGNAATSAPPAAQVPPPAAGERMFLYEEVLGQAVPTAVPGSVAWSLQSEPGADGKPSPTVQGQVSIPGRGLSALITFKRNSDPSLPASHLVEIVFSVSPSFEGGAIDSVQRIAMKSTEQDRGNALIAVPAKITDDFHMIALNDFPDALKTNLELLRSRDWIDIPVSYRNGRRALLTMQKGPAGKAAFDTALREWAAAAPAAKP